MDSLYERLLIVTLTLYCTLDLWSSELSSNLVVHTIIVHLMCHFLAKYIYSGIHNLVQLWFSVWTAVQWYTLLPHVCSLLFVSLSSLCRNNGCQKCEVVLQDFHASFATFTVGHVIKSNCHAMLCISTAYAVMRCLSVCLCVCHVHELCQKE